MYIEKPLFSQMEFESNLRYLIDHECLVYIHVVMKAVCFLQSFYNKCVNKKDCLGHRSKILKL